MSERGHTLIELTMVVTIVGVLASATVISLRGLDATRQNLAAVRIRSALVYAQETAMSSDADTWVVFDESTEQVSVFVEDPANPGSANRLALADPLTRKAMTLSLSDSGAGIESADFGGTLEVQFDQSGLPYDEHGDALTDDGTVTVTGGGVVRVTRNTGLISVD